MVSLKLQKRLAASVLKCGKRRVWLDPSRPDEIAGANSRQFILPPSSTLPSQRRLLFLMFMEFSSLSGWIMNAHLIFCLFYF